MTGRTCLAIATTMTAVGCPQALAAPTWLPAVNVSPPDHAASNVDFAVDGQGNVTAAWSIPGGLYATTRPAGAASVLGARRVSTPGYGADAPQVGVDGQGDVTLVWRHHEGGGRKFQAATRPAGAAHFSVPQDLTALHEDPSSGENVDHVPRLAVDRHGNAAAVWTHRIGQDDYVVQAATRSSGSGYFSSPQDLSTGPEYAGDYRNADSPDVGIDGQGNVTAVWRRKGSSPEHGSSYLVQTSTRPAGAASFSNPQSLTSLETTAETPRIAVGEPGNATIVWGVWRDTGRLVQAASRPAGAGFFSDPRDVSAPGQQFPSPAIAMDGRGVATAVWTSAGSAGSFVQAATRPVGPFSTSFSSPRNISGEGAHNPKVAAAADGEVTALWNRSDGTDSILQAVTLGGRSLSKPQDLTGPGRRALEAKVAYDEQGNATAAWISVEKDYSGVVQMAVLDAAGPALSSLSVPATAVAGTAAGFSVVAEDRWSKLGAVAWDFGDGQKAMGTGASHAYVTPGTYTVTVTAADEHGNTSTASAPVTVGAPAGPDPITQPLDRTAPVITAASLSRKRFAVKRNATAFRYSLSEAATVRVKIARAVPGRKVAGKCRKPTRANRAKKRCTRYARVGLIAHQAAAGTNRKAFGGKIAAKKLKPGRHRATLVAIDAAGNASSPVRLTFKVARRR